MVCREVESSRVALNVLHERAGHTTEPVTANEIARSTSLWTLTGCDRFGCMTGSLVKYVISESRDPSFMSVPDGMKSGTRSICAR